MGFAERNRDDEVAEDLRAGGCQNVGPVHLDDEIGLAELPAVNPSRRLGNRVGIPERHARVDRTHTARFHRKQLGRD